MPLYLYIVFYLIAAILIIWLVKKVTINMNPYQRIAIVSFCYAFFFGIGIAGQSNADPGFALPAPVALSIVGDIKTGWNPIVNICFFIFWWVVIGGIKLYLYIANRKDEEKLAKNTDV
jgi:hypothetical protein